MAHAREQPSSLDPVLEPFARVVSHEESEELLAQILREHADPIIRSILVYKVRTCVYAKSRQLEDSDDIRSDIHVSLIRRLRRLRGVQPDGPIASLRGYVAKTTYNAFNDYLRRVYPAWARLKHRIRHLLANIDGFAAWEGYDGDQHCGLAHMRAKPVAAQAMARLQAFVDGGAAMHGVAPAGELGHPELRHLVTELFRFVGSPLDVDHVVGAVATLAGIGSDIAEPEPDERTADPVLFSERTVTEIDQRTYLNAVWKEICELPLRQRIALLLNLEEVHALPIFDVASMRQIADVVGMAAEELAALWRELPLQDAVIAARLGLGRQKIINLRKAARDRLGRRMRRYGASHVF